MAAETTRARLGQELEQALRAIMVFKTFPKGAELYRHGSPADRIFLIEKGQVRVSLKAGDRQNQLLEVAGPGAILGLSDCMAGGSYRVSADAQEPVSALFLTRDSFVDFLNSHHEFCMQVVALLSDNLHGLYHKFRSVSAHPGRPRRRSPNERLI